MPINGPANHGSAGHKISHFLVASTNNNSYIILLELTVLQLFKSMHQKILVALHLANIVATRGKVGSLGTWTLMRSYYSANIIPDVISLFALNSLGIILGCIIDYAILYLVTLGIIQYLKG